MRGIVTVELLFWVAIAKAATAPNIIYILVDDWGYQDVGFRGSDILTPNMNKLARNGVILKNHYVSSICSPTRASLMTGRYPIRTGYWNGNHRMDTPWGLPLKETTMAEMLSRKGYSTHAVGKWHLGFHTHRHLPVSRGFDTFLGFMAACTQDHFQHTDGFHKMFDMREQHRNEIGGVQDNVLYGLRGQYSADIFTNRTIKLIESHSRSNPLFVYLAYSNVHDPLQAPQEAIEKYTEHLSNTADHKRRVIAAMISKVDEGVGRIVSGLIQAGLYDNTIIVISSDNGGPSGHSSNYPLRGEKRTLYEGGVRSLAFLHSSLLSKTGYVNQQIFHVVDWYRTFQRLGGEDVDKKNIKRDDAEGKDVERDDVDEKNVERDDVEGKDVEGKDVKPQLELDGVDIWDAISSNKSLSRNEVLLNYGHNDLCHDCPLNKDHPADYGFAVRRGKWKLIEDTKYGHSVFTSHNCSSPVQHIKNPSRIQLYNLRSDPREMVNLAAVNHWIVEQLRARKAHYHSLTRHLYFHNTRSFNVRNGTVYWWS